MKLAIFGAGMYGKQALAACKIKYKSSTVRYFIDNDKNKEHTYLGGIEIISLKQFCNEYASDDFKVIIATKIESMKEIEKQLLDCSIYNYEKYDASGWHGQGRLISYSHIETMEDVILYNIFKDEEDIFYIDLGSNDPIQNSCTKLLYDMKNARGINVEPQIGLYEITKMERPRDICINACVGDKSGKVKIYMQNERSTAKAENVIDEKCNYEEVDVITLNEICEKYVNDKNISFLKIDVEGYEKEVICAFDFKKYRPNVLCVEACNEEYKDWEQYVLGENYFYVKTVGVNRWYVSYECQIFAKKILSTEQLNELYNIIHFELR